MFLGIMLRRTRWPELLPAAGVSFLILSIGGLMESIAEWNHANADGVTIGSFHLTRLAFLNPTLSDVTLGLLGAGQLLIEFATAFLCLLLSRHLRGSRAQAALSSKQEGARRARLGRLAIYASSGFLVLMIRLPVWSTYIEIINDSRIVREFVLKNDFGRTNRPPACDQADQSRKCGCSSFSNCWGMPLPRRAPRISRRREKPTSKSSRERNPPPRTRWPSRL